MIRHGVKWPWHDMMPMIPCMARAASGVGFGITMSTTYHHPFYVARLFNALDHVTEGRIAWNAVTSRSKNEAANWGHDKLIEHDARYEQAQEHLHVVRALWDSVEDGAVVFDRESGVFGDPEKVHVLNFRGRYYNVPGPLPSLRSPQGRPVIIQAGQSGPGLDLAATYADMQFSTRRTIPSMKEHRARLDAKLQEFGRSPRDCGIYGRCELRSRSPSARHRKKSASIWIQSRRKRASSNYRPCMGSTSRACATRRGLRTWRTR